MNPADPTFPKPSFEYGMRSVPEVVQSWHPHYDSKWKSWIRESYARYASNEEDTHLQGVKDFAIILGDSGAPELCVLLSLYGVLIPKTERDRNYIESHIRIVTVRLGIERHKYIPPSEHGVPTTDYIDREKWLIDRPA